MGDLADDTRVARTAEGHYRADVSSDWEVWGPAGGYVASIALRAAGAHTELPRPASIQGHFLGVAEFEPVDIEVDTIRRSRRAESLRVRMRQHDRPLFEALVWAVGELDGLDHVASRRPTPPSHDALPDFETRLRSVGEEPRHAYWQNIEYRPIDWRAWHERAGGEPEDEGWWRFRPTAAFDDPWVDVCRGLMLVDMTTWPAACQAYSDEMEYYAPSIDVSCTFHTVAPDADWLYAWAESPLARDGLVGGRAEVWSADGRLIASGGGTLLCRPAVMRPDTP